MHRFNLASSLLEQKCSPQAAESVASAAAAAAKIYVWLRYSSQRKLTWQRYNVKPRELSAAQSSSRASSPSCTARALTSATSRD